MRIDCNKHGKVEIIWTDDDRKMHQKIMQFINRKSLQSINKKNFLLNLDMQLIIFFAEENETFLQWLQQTDLKDYWQDAWKLLSRFPSWSEAQKDKKLTYCELIPQDAISCFDLVRGMCFSIQADSPCVCILPRSSYPSPSKGKATAIFWAHRSPDGARWKEFCSSKISCTRKS